MKRTVRNILTMAILLLGMVPGAMAEEHADTLLTDSVSTVGESRWMRPTLPRYGWLHEGLNVSADLSVFCTFGSGRTPGGAGFAERLGIDYVTRLSPKATLVAGAYVANLNWGNWSGRTAGLRAMLQYDFNERLTGYAWVQKSVVQTPMPLMMCDPQELADRFGAALQYSFAPGFSVGVSVEGIRYNDGSSWLHPFAGQFQPRGIEW